jgi:hypothetical protein
LTDTHDPGWSATVDGRPVPIRPAWLTFRAVALGPGRHLVAFRYEPAGFRFGLSVTLAGLVVAVILWFWRSPGPSLAPEHGESSWPASWPRWGLAVLALIVVLSIPGSEGGRLRLQSRWDDSFHTFTWGAGIEAMRTVAPG